MAYQIGRSRRIQETLELVDSQGNVVHQIPVDLDVDRVATGFNRCYNAVIRAQLEIKKCNADDDPQKYEKTLEEIGNVIIELIKFVFGDDGAKILFEFYEDKQIELLTCVLPYIDDIVMPAMQAAIAEQRQQLAKNYKVKQAHKFAWSTRQ